MLWKSLSLACQFPALAAATADLIWGDVGCHVSIGIKPPISKVKKSRWKLGSMIAGPPITHPNNKQLIAMDSQEVLNHAQCCQRTQRPDEVHVDAHPFRWLERSCRDNRQHRKIPQFRTHTTFAK